MRKHNMKKNNNKNYLSIFVTIFVITILIFAGPGQALNLTMSTFTNAAPVKGDTISVTASITIEDEELLTALPDVDLYIDGVIACSFDPITGLGCVQPGITVSTLSTATFGYGYDGYTEGYGYGYDTGVDGYYTGSFSYKITIDTNEFGVIGETYALKIGLPLVGPTGGYFSNERSFKINPASAPSLGSVSTSTNVLDSALADGYERFLAVGHSLKFNVQGQSHKLTIDEVTETTAKITVSSTPQTNTLSVGDTWEVDVTDDGVKDLLVELTGISGGRASVKVTSIDGTTATEEDTTTTSEETQTTTTEDTTTTEEETQTTEEETAVIEDETKSNAWIWYVIIVLALLVILYFVFDNKPKNKKF